MVSGLASDKPLTIDVLDLPLLHQLLELANRLLDGNCGVNVVLVIEVDAVDVKAAQAGLAAGADVLRPSAHGPRAALVTPYPELGGHLHLLPRQLLQRLHTGGDVFRRGGISAGQ